MLSIVIGAVDNEAEGGGKGSVVFNLRLVFLSACFVKLAIDEGFHGVEVKNVLCDLVVGV